MLEDLKLIEVYPLTNWFLPVVAVHLLHEELGGSPWWHLDIDLNLLTILLIIQQVAEVTQHSICYNANIRSYPTLKLLDANIRSYPTLKLLDANIRSYPSFNLL